MHFWGWGYFHTSTSTPRVILRNYCTRTHGRGETLVASAAPKIKFETPGTTHTHVGTIPYHFCHAGWCVAADNDADTDPTCTCQTADATHRDTRDTRTRLRTETNVHSPPFQTESLEQLGYRFCWSAGPLRGREGLWRAHGWFRRVCCGSGPDAAEMFEMAISYHHLLRLTSEFLR